MFYKKGVVLEKDKCLRCGHTWYRRKPEKPIMCPGCGSPYWHKPRRKDSENVNIPRKA